MIVINSLFSFNRPARLTAEEYYEMKLFLNKYPNYDFTSKISFYNERREMILFVSIAIIVSMLLISIQKEGINVAIGGLLMTFALIAGLFFLLPEYSSFLKMKKEMKKYYDRLKHTIIASKDYSEFKLHW